jgi:GT2 family glycosyltransferase
MTINRYPGCVENLEYNLAICGIDLSNAEILWADNGSADPQCIRYGISKTEPRLAYERMNSKNEGVARTLNQLIMRSRGEFVVQLGNDYHMPRDWLRYMIWHAKNIGNTGMVGITWQGQTTNRQSLPTRKGGLAEVDLRPFDKPLFGVKLKTRELLDKVGAFDPAFHPYGYEDSDYHHRATVAGFRNYYIVDAKARHLGDGILKDPLRTTKDKSLADLRQYYESKLALYRDDNYYIPWPAPEEPL